MTKSAKREASKPATRTVFCLATAHVATEDRQAARDLGSHLYDVLTRECSNPLAFGPSIPVAVGVDQIWDHSQWIAERADHVLLVLVAGASSLLLEPDATCSRIERFAAPGTKLHKLLLPTDARWIEEASNLKGVEVADTLFDPGDPEAAIDWILISIARSFASPLAQRPRLFISDRLGTLPKAATKELIGGHGQNRAKLLRYFSAIEETRGGGEFAQRSDSRPAAIGAVPTGVLVAVREANEPRSSSFERDVILAKRQGWPVVVVDASGPASHAVSPYVGNIPVYQRDGGLHRILRAAVLEHLRQSHFALMGQRLIESAGLPLNTRVLGRSPELLDVSAGSLRGELTRVILHPDPPLPPEDREVLRAAAPLMHTVTPSTLLGRGQQDGSDRLITPLDGVRIGISVSDIPNVEFGLGQTMHHLEDATIQLTRTLISGGGAIAYGGNFKLGRATSFTPMLAELVRTYNQTTSRPAERLRVFQPADGQLQQIPGDVQCVVRHLSQSSDLKREAVFNDQDAKLLPTGMNISDMRRAMTAETDARIAVGGQSLPKSTDGPGYSGRFPGVAEEVFRAVAAGQPVYLCGGFGGVTRRLSQLLENPKKIDDYWNEASYADNRRFVGVAWNVDHHPKRSELNLPSGLREMAETLARVALTLGDDDKAWLKWNGLSKQQNKTLWHATDPVLVGALVSDGLIRWRAQHLSRSGKHRVEAIRGDVTQVTRADVMAVPIFEDVEPQGAGSAIDRVTDGAVRQGQNRPGHLIALRSDQLDVDYLYVLSLGLVTEYQNDRGALREAIVRESKTLMDRCLREGFVSLAVVTFGGSTLNEYASAVGAMLEGFGSARTSLIIKWVERSEDKFATLVDLLRQEDSVEVTTVVQPVSETPVVRYSWFHLTVKWHDNQLEVTALPSAGTGLAWERSVRLSKDDLLSLARGAGTTGHATPNRDELRERGRQLAELLFDKEAKDFWNNDPDVAIAVTHDQESSRIPFEVLQFPLSEAGEQDDLGRSAPAIRGGVHRRLAIRGGRVESLFARPKLSGKLRIGLVINPTGDLQGAVDEGEHLRRMLKPMSGDIQLVCLAGAEVTATGIKDLLRQVDVLHFCGHAMFDANHPERSGLILADQETLTATQMQEVQPLPRVMIFNACQAARVRGAFQQNDPGSASLASFMLMAGVEGFVGTFWEVDDKSAAEFSSAVYQGLIDGKTLRDSVTDARKGLAADGRRDWANYILYGDGRFRLT
jgi:hypothetical protein